MNLIVGLDEFQHRYSTDAACAKALIQMKWPEGFRCPRCAYHFAYVTSTRKLPLFECRLCRHQTSPIAGTVMERSRTPLTKWFLAIYLMSRTSLRGISALSFSRTAGVTYKTAWLMLHKIRHAVSRLDHSLPLYGAVRAQTELYSRQPFHPSLDRHPREHPVVIGISAAEPHRSPYVKIKLIPGTPIRESMQLTAAMKRFASRYIAPRTDQPKLLPHRYDKSRSKTLKQCWRTMNKWLFVTFHGIGPKHLQAYLDEFCVRLNLSLNKQPIFPHLAIICASWPTITYRALVHPAPIPCASSAAA